MKKKGYTLVFILPELLSIARFSSDMPPKLLTLEEKTRSEESESLLNALEEALTGTALGSKVFVLTSEIWLQTITFSKRRVSFLKPNEIQQALTFEAESSSGILAGESCLTWKFLGSQDAESFYGVLQMLGTQMQQIESLLRTYKTQFAGIAHPAAIPLPVFSLEGISPEEWQRIELWPDCVVGVLQSNETKKIPIFHVLHQLPQMGDWEGELEAWFQKFNFPLGNHLMTSHRGIAVVSQNYSHFVNLEFEEKKKAWLEAWASIIFSPASTLLFLAPTKRPLSTKTHLLIALALMALTVLGCLGIHYRLHQKKASLQQELLLVKTPIQEWERLQRSVRELKKELEKTETLAKEKQDDFRLFQELFNGQRERYAFLLKALGEACPQDTMIQEIVQEFQQIRLRGISLNANDANWYAQQLQKTLKGVGWDVRSPLKTNLTGTLAWKFEIEIIHSP